MNPVKKIFWALISIIVLTASIYLIYRLTPGFLGNIEPKSELKNFPMAPDFVLDNLNGQKIKLSDLRGKIVILNFWTSWNEASLEQAKILSDYYKSYSPKDTVVLEINSGENPELVKTIKNRESLGVEILLDTDGLAGELYGISTLPLTVFIGKAGLQAEKITGPLAIKEIEEKITSLR